MKVFWIMPLPGTDGCYQVAHDSRPSRERPHLMALGLTQGGVGHGFGVGTGFGLPIGIGLGVGFGLLGTAWPAYRLACSWLAARGAQPGPRKRPWNLPRRLHGRFALDQELLRIRASPVESSKPNAQTWPGLLAAELIVNSEPDGSGLGEVVHDEPFQLAIAWL